LSFYRCFTCGSICFYFSSCSTNNKEDSNEKISYNFQVRPILSDKCFKCHGPDANKREAGLRLDIEAEAYKALRDHPRAHAIIPGFPDSSELFARITSTDTSYRMPPVESYMTPLTEDQIAIIKKWIEQGAHYEKHWAFQPPQKACIT
jgi:hypothetical protein